MKTDVSSRLALVVAAGLLVWTACDQGATSSTGPTGPIEPSGPGELAGPTGSGPSFDILPGGAGPDVNDGNGVATHEEFELCKVGSAATFDYTIVEQPSGPTTTGSVTLSDGECRILALFGAAGALITVTEQDPVGFDLDNVVLTTIVDGVVTVGAPSTSATVGPVLISGAGGPGGQLHGALAVYTNVPEPPPPPPPPPPGGEGCTPGYWKNHAGADSHSNGGQMKPSSWEGFDPSDGFDATFGVTSSFGGTLMEALTRGGGGEIALGRHAVAALLNAANSGVQYDLDVAGVIAVVQAAYGSGDFEGAKDTLATLNEQGCPL